MAVMRARRRVAGLGMVAVALALWMLLEFPGVPEAEPGDAEAPEPVPVGVPRAPVVAATVGEADLPVGGPLDEAALVQADHLGGILYAARAAVAQGRFGAACADLERASALQLAPPLEPRRAACEREVAQALADRVSTVAELVDRGRVVEAASQVRLLRDPRHPRADTALLQTFEGRGWPGLPDQRPDVHDLAPPPALAANRLVRFLRRGIWHEGHAMRSRGGSDVTVRLQLQGRVEFPFVARAALEPVAATQTEAADQAIAALRSGDPVLAALWLRYAERADGDDARLLDLAARLR